MKNFLSMLVLLALTASNLNAQSLDNTYLGCNSFRVDFTGPILSNIYTVANTVNCYPGTRRIAGSLIPGAQYQLQQRDGNGNFFNVGNPFQSNAPSKTYTNLGVGIYRVSLLQRLSNGLPVYTYGNPCMTNAVGIAYTSGFNLTFISPEIEIGTPTVSNIIYPVPTGSPAAISYSLIDAPSEPLVVIGESSFGERGYHVAVFKDNLAGQNVGYASSGWIDGKMTSFDLKSLNMFYEPGYKYTVQLALTQLPCTGWVDQVKIFRITTPREDGELSEVTAFPNPTSDVLNFEGLETWGSDEISVNVLDLFGKKVMETTVIAPEFSISLADLPKGTYLVQVKNQENAVTKKVVRL